MWKYLGDRPDLYEHTVYYVEQGVDLWRCSRLKVCFYQEPEQKNKLAIFTVRRSGFSFRWDYFIDDTGKIVEFPFGQVDADIEDWRNDPNWEPWVLAVQRDFRSILDDAWARVHLGRPSRARL